MENFSISFFFYDKVSQDLPGNESEISFELIWQLGVKLWDGFFLGTLTWKKIFFVFHFFEMKSRLKLVIH